MRHDAPLIRFSCQYRFRFFFREQRQPVVVLLFSGLQYGGRRIFSAHVDDTAKHRASTGMPHSGLYLVGLLFLCIDQIRY